MRRRKANIVYSTDPEPEQPRKKKSKRPTPPGSQVAELRRERKGRGGKTVTTITGLRLPSAELKQLAKQLKRACGAGGAIKNGVIEIQGDHRDKIAVLLQDKGVKTKFVGG